MCRAMWPTTDFFQAAGSGDIKETCPHCRYRSAYKAACRLAKLEHRPEPEWGFWQPSGSARALATPCYDPFTGAVWSAADARHRTPCFAASREDDLARLKPFTPLLSPAHRPQLDADGCWIMPQSQPQPKPEPEPQAQPRRPIGALAATPHVSTPSLFDQADPGQAIITFTRGDCAISAQDGDVLITLRVAASSLRSALAAASKEV